MSEAPGPGVRRILVTLDMSPLGTAALEAAARLAIDLRAELQGLFIEDANLLRLAGLPFAKEIDDASGVLRPLDTAAMERTLQAKAERVRQAIEQMARRSSLRWSFRISRGNLAQTLLTESREADFFLVGRQTISPGVSPARRRRGPVMFIDEGTHASQRVFETAQQLARPQADTIVALVMRDDVQTSARSGGGASPVFVQQCPGNVEALLRTVQHWRPQLLLLDRSSQLLSEATLNSLVMQLPCPLGLVQ